MGFLIVLLGVIGIPVGFFLASLIGQIILVKSSSYEEITGIRFLKFFFGFGNNKNDTKQGFSLFPFVEAEFRPDVEIDEDRARRESVKGLIIVGVAAIIYLILFIVLFKPSPAYLNAFSVGALVGVIIALIMIAISSLKAKQRDDFRIFLNGKIEELKRSSRPDQVSMPDIESLTKYNPTPSAAESYQFLRYMWAEMVNYTDTVYDILKWFEKRYKSPYNSTLFNQYFVFLNYFSIYDIDMRKAKPFYNEIKSDLHRNENPASLRVYAFYSYNILGDVDAAYKACCDGLNMLEDSRLDLMKIEKDFYAGEFNYLLGVIKENS
ncbi:MAG: hypothetical protein J6U23_00615 [Clostridiales bacterium]|nr:hypothetical protein [Clostridiales bacterium]